MQLGTIKFPFKNEWDGLFAYYRKFSDDIIKNQFVSIVSPELYYADTFCNPGYFVSERISLIDGNLTKCMAIKESSDSSYAYFIINLMKNKMKLSGIGIKTSCCYPPMIDVSAGQSQNSLTSIGTIQTINAENTEFFIPFSSDKEYQYFKFTMTQRSYCNLNIWRLQLAELEFFGTLNPRIICTKNHFITGNLNILFMLYLEFST